jgi:hypothetical protein
MPKQSNTGIFARAMDDKFTPAGHASYTDIPLSPEMLDLSNVSSAEVTVAFNKVTIKKWKNGGVSLGLLVCEVAGVVNGVKTHNRVAFGDEGEFKNDIEVTVRTANTDLGRGVFVGSTAEEQELTRKRFMAVCARADEVLESNPDLITEKFYDSFDAIVWDAGKGADRQSIVFKLKAEPATSSKGTAYTRWEFVDWE